jgi:hypothetical protein
MTEEEHTKCCEEPLYFCRRFFPETTYNGQLQYNPDQENQIEVIHHNDRIIFHAATPKPLRARVPLMFGIWLALTQENQKVIAVSPNMWVSRILLNDALVVIKEMSPKMVPVITKIGLNELQFKNGSSIRFCIYDATSLLGVDSTYLFLSEYAYAKVQESFFDTIYGANHPKIVIASQVNGGSHFNKLLEENTTFTKVSLDG